MPITNKDIDVALKERRLSKDLKEFAQEIKYFSEDMDELEEFLYEESKKTDNGAVCEW